MNLSGKTVLITGGSNGIGLALAALLRGKGCQVYSLDRMAPAEPVQGVQTLQDDVTREDDVRRALRDIAGPIDVLINNAGIMRRGTLLESSTDDFDALFGVNVKGPWLVLKEARPLLRDDAMIVQMCSRHALDPPTDPALYALSKQTAAHLAEAVARAYPRYIVKILFPGPVDTHGVGRHGVSAHALPEKLARMSSPDVVAPLIVDLMESDKTRLVFDNETWSYRTE